jgi:glutamyl-tRNA synthetase
LYNYLFARKHNGTVILRIEDTDRSRFVEGAVENLVETLRWTGLEFDEGPGKGGPYGPYIQSERLHIYREHVGTLLRKKFAYHCFCMPARLDAMRRNRDKSQPTSKYDRQCLRLSDAEVQKNLQENLPHVVRMKIPDVQIVCVDDLVRGKVEIHSDMLDDQILLKSDGYPTYHLANVVDDHLMGVTHVIRGEEWLPSTPKHVLLYEFFRWTLPKFAHLPLLLNPDRSKLSKRQGDVAVEDYRARGYLPEALLNFVALLGWNPGHKQELFSLEELVREFSLEQVNKAGAIFDIDKLNWLNAEHLRRKSTHEILVMVRNALAQSKYAGSQFNDDYLAQVIEAMRPRVSFVKEFVENCPYFFEAPTTYDQEVAAKRWKQDTPLHMTRLVEEFSKLENPGTSEYEASLRSVAQSLEVGNAHLIHPLRLALSGVGGGPGVYDILHILGKEESLRRIKAAVERIKHSA